MTSTLSSNPKLPVIAPVLGAADAVLKQSDKLAVISPIIGAADAVPKHGDKLAVTAPLMGAADGVLKEIDKLPVISPIMDAADGVLKSGINFSHTGAQVSPDPGPRGGDRGTRDCEGKQGLMVLMGICCSS